jgi:rhodanese-related sulfurtransferase
MSNTRRKPVKKKTTPLYMWGALALVALVLLYAIFTLANGQTQQAGSGGPQAAAPAGEALPKEISVEEAANMRDSGALMLDVREQSEWDEYHMPGARLIPLGQLESRLSDLPKDQDIVVVCRSGNRSATGRDVLLQNGFTRVTSMAGGMKDWQASGLPTQTGP